MIFSNKQRIKKSIIRVIEVKEAKENIKVIVEFHQHKDDEIDNDLSINK